MRFMILMLAAVLLPAAAVAQEAIVYGATYVEVAPGATSQAVGLLKALGAARTATCASRWCRSSSVPTASS
jgi:hypothetical protein